MGAKAQILEQVIRPVKTWLAAYGECSLPVAACALRACLREWAVLQVHDVMQIWHLLDKLGKAARFFLADDWVKLIHGVPSPAHRLSWIRFLNVNEYSLMDVSKRDFEDPITVNKMGLHQETWAALTTIAETLQQSPNALTAFESSGGDDLAEFYKFKHLDMGVFAAMVARGATILPNSDGTSQFVAPSELVRPARIISRASSPTLKLPAPVTAWDPQDNSGYSKILPTAMETTDLENSSSMESSMEEEQDTTLEGSMSPTQRAAPTQDSTPDDGTGLYFTAVTTNDGQTFELQEHEPTPLVGAQPTPGSSQADPSSSSSSPPPGQLGQNINPLHVQGRPSVFFPDVPLVGGSSSSLSKNAAGKRTAGHPYAAFSSGNNRDQRDGR
jgi:hypothetical protein